MYQIFGFYIIDENADEAAIEDIAVNGCTCRKTKINYLGMLIIF